MPSAVKTYWNELDKITELTVEEVLEILMVINMTKIYQGDELYIRRIFNRYSYNIEKRFITAAESGRRLFNDVMKNIDVKPGRITKAEIKATLKRSRYIMRKYLNNAINSFHGRLQAQAAEMRGLGMSKNSIIEYFFDERNRDRPLFHRFNNLIKKIADDALDRTAGMMYNEGFKKIFITDRKMKFTWVAVGDPRVCPDCKLRHKKEHIYGEWLKIGVPRGGFTYCLSSCRCILFPSQYVDDELDLTKIQIRHSAVKKVA